MTLDIIAYRLHNQRLSQTDLTQPAEVVSWLGAVQAQDFAGAKWAIGLRAKGLCEPDIERAFTQGAILRTHLLRPTWHFVTPADIRWMLALTAPRVRALLAHMDRRLDLDKNTLHKSNDVLTKTLQGGKQWTRIELGSTLQKSGINTDELRLTHLIMHAELDGILCSGGRQGKQFTYALLDERVPPARPMERKEALEELVRRYFTAHGPAMLKDFIWWSGLSAADAKQGLEAVRSTLEHASMDGETYWFRPATTKPKRTGVRAHLLPNYDEYTVGYTERGSIFDSAHTDKLDARGSILAQHAILLGGRVVGTWKRTFQKNVVAMQAILFKEVSKNEMHAIIEAAEQYANFLKMSFALDLQDSKIS